MSSQSSTPHQPQLSFALAFACLIMGAIAMGASPVFVRFSEIGPFASAFWRVFLGLPVLLLWAWIEARRTRQALSFQFDQALVLSGIFFAGDLIFWHLAIHNTTMANATLMATLAPIWVALLSGTFIGETVSRQIWIGLALCIIGAGMLIGSSYQIAPGRVIGDIYGIITSVFFGLYFLAMRVSRRKHGAGSLTFLSTVVTMAVLFLVAIFSGNKMLPDTIQGWAALVTLGTFSHAGGQGLLAVALGSLSAVFSSLVIFVEALAAAIFGWLIFDEKLGVLQLAGAALILIGIWTARPRPASQ